MAKHYKKAICIVVTLLVAVKLAIAGRLVAEMTTQLVRFNNTATKHELRADDDSRMGSTSFNASQKADVAANATDGEWRGRKESLYDLHCNWKSCLIQAIIIF